MNGWILVFWLGLDPWGLPPVGMEHILVGMYTSKAGCDEVRSGYVAGWNANGVHGPAPAALSDCIPALLPHDGKAEFKKTWVRP